MIKQSLIITTLLSSAVIVHGSEPAPNAKHATAEPGKVTEASKPNIIVFLVDDIGEKQNLAEKNPAKRREPANLLHTRLKSMNAQMPTEKASGKAVTIPGVTDEP